MLTHEPTDGPWGRLLRESATSGRLSPEEELETFLKDRKQHVDELIRPSLEAGKVVITDRYYFSTVAYQGARGFDPGELLRRNEEIAIEPHLLVLMDLDPRVSLQRIDHRDGVTNEFESTAQLERSREIFLSIRKPYLLVLDARAAADENHAAILFGFARAALRRIAMDTNLTEQEKLDASLALHGRTAEGSV